MFSFLKKKNTVILGSPVKGTAIPLSEVSDPTFGDGILGQGVAVIPAEGKIYAPADGEIGLVFETLHAISMTIECGAEVLLHIGLDTVQLKGKGFEAHAALGDKVKKGDLLLTVDLDLVKEAGFDIVTPMIICNTDDYASVEGLAGKEVMPGDDILKITLK